MKQNISKELTKVTNTDMKVINIHMKVINTDMKVINIHMKVINTDMKVINIHMKVINIHMKVINNEMKVIKTDMKVINAHMIRLIKINKKNLMWIQLANYTIKDLLQDFKQNLTILNEILWANA